MDATGPNVTRSRPNPGVGYLGEISEEVWDVVEKAWAMPFFISSNFARGLAIETAFAASLGWISNITPDGKGFSRQWHITMEGMVALRNIRNN